MVCIWPIAPRSLMVTGKGLPFAGKQPMDVPIEIILAGQFSVLVKIVDVLQKRDRHRP